MENLAQEDFVLDIQNVTQENKIKTMGKKLKDMVISREDEVLENGHVKITIILDPKKGED